MKELDHHRTAAENKPVDHIRVRSGRIAADDLVYCFATKTFLRHDDPAWKSRCEFVADAVYVVRYAEPRRQIRKEPEQVELSVVGQLQINLF